MSFKVGDKVRIIKADATYWDPGFDRYVGMTAVMLRDFGKDRGRNIWEISIDGGPASFGWYTVNLELIGTTAGFVSSSSDLTGAHPIKASKPAEGPCKNKTCGKMNDVGIGKCWSCECEDPVPR